MGISALDPPGGSSFEGFPCIFPVDQGSDSRDEFAIDSTHRHLVCACRNFPRTPRYSLRNLRDSAGSWRSGLRASGPETGGLRAWQTLGACPSLSAIRPVRPRRGVASRSAGDSSVRALGLQHRGTGRDFRVTSKSSVVFCVASVRSGVRVRFFLAVMAIAPPKDSSFNLGFSTFAGHG